MLAIAETLNLNFNDNTMSIACNDTAGICTIGTDFIFDALNPLGYATGVLPATGSAAGNLVNLARNVQPGIPRTGTVTATAFTAGQGPLFDGKGWAFDPSANQKEFIVQKSGVLDYRVCEPTLEGFISFLDIFWVKLTAASNVGVGGSGQAGGSNPTGFIEITAGGAYLAEPTDFAIGAAATGVLTQVAIAFTFNTGAGTSHIDAFLNGSPVASGAGLAIASYVANNTNARTLIGNVQGATGMTGSIRRVVREYHGISGVNPAAFVAADYAANVTRLS